MTARRQDSVLRQAKPTFVTCPRNRPSFPNTIRNTDQGFTPPGGLANHPRPPSLTRVAKLRKNAPRNHPNCKGQRAPYQSAPELVPCMTMMNTNLISRLPGVMVTDRNNRRETARHNLPPHIASRSPVLRTCGKNAIQNRPVEDKWPDAAPRPS